MQSDEMAARGVAELLPCPFCGGMAEIVEISEGENSGGSCVCCTRCMASSNVEFAFKENFVGNWNRRATPAALAASPEVQALIRGEIEAIIAAWNDDPVMSAAVLALRNRIAIRAEAAALKGET